MKKHLLVINPGSSSLKFSLYPVDKNKLKKAVISGQTSPDQRGLLLSYGQASRRKKIHFASHYNTKNSWQAISDLLKDYTISYVGLRVVHGGEEFRETVKIDKNFLTKIKAYDNLAPLHNPLARELMKLVKDSWPQVKMAASFDTAFYAGLPPEQFLYSIPLKYYEQHKIRKYGFHGLSHESAINFAAKVLGRKLNKFSAISCHLGSGSSLTWLSEGRVKDTTMGFSPNEGLTMSTRSGDLPSDIVLFMLRELKMSATAVSDLLNKRSGLLGIAGSADLRNILIANGYTIPGYQATVKLDKAQKKLAKLALAIYVYDVRRFLAGYMAMSRKLDAIVFTGAIGAHSAIIRRLVLKGLKLPATASVVVAEDNENYNIAEKTLKCLV